MGQNGSENVGDHKLASDLGKNRSENSPTRLKTGRRFSVSDLSPTVNAQPAYAPQIIYLGLFLKWPIWEDMPTEGLGAAHLDLGA